MLIANLAGLVLAALLTVADPMSFEYSGQTDAGGTAFLVIRANQALDDLEVVITGDGQTIKKSIGSMRNGQTVKVSWKQKSAQARYSLEVGGANVEANFAFEIAKAKGGGQKLGKLKVRSTREDIIDRQTAMFETSFDLANYEYKIYDGDGDIFASDLVTDGVAAGGQFTIKWSDDADVFMIHVKGEDKFGRFTEYKLVPWAVEIPHTEINFDSGKWNIKNGESPKLDEAVAVAFHELVALEKVNKAVGANLTPRLYIVGYTDTVGGASSNQKLSNSRAKEIAGYFRDKGFWAAIYYAGMGERGLRVETGDSVDEVRNRRALYLIGVQDPAGGGQIPSRWSKLVGARSQPPGFELPALPEKWANYREERRNKRKGNSGEPSVEGDLPSGGSDRELIGETGEETVYDDDIGDGDDGGPPPVEGEPGATSKGCRVDPGPSAPGAVALLALLGLGFLRRRR